jgi:hypothetical protein
LIKTVGPSGSDGDHIATGDEIGLIVDRGEDDAGAIGDTAEGGFARCTVGEVDRDEVRAVEIERGAARNRGRAIAGAREVLDRRPPDQARRPGHQHMLPSPVAQDLPPGAASLTPARSSCYDMGVLSTSPSSIFEFVLGPGAGVGEAAAALT